MQGFKVQFRSQGFKFQGFKVAGVEVVGDVVGECGVADVVALPPHRPEPEGSTTPAAQRRLTAIELIRSIGLVGLVRPATDAAAPDRAELGRAGPDRAASDRAELGRAAPQRTVPGRAMPTPIAPTPIAPTPIAPASIPSAAGAPASTTSVRAAVARIAPVRAAPIRAESARIASITETTSASSAVAPATVVARMPTGAAAGLNAGNVAGGLGAPQRLLPVVRGLQPLLPGGGLRRGSTVATSGATSLLISLLAGASQAGSWCAIVGMPTLGAVAAAEAGLSLDRLALVPHPGPEWPTVVAALLDGVDVVVAVPPGPIGASMSSRLAARARQRGSVFVAYGHLPGADLVLNSTRSRWEGLGRGVGRLRQREMTIMVRGRGAAAQSRQGTFWAPVTTSLNAGWHGDKWGRLDRNSAPRSLTLVDRPVEPIFDDAGLPMELDPVELGEVAS